ncbi:hypothetical protein GOBAR_AA06968 [Gossypium barbadense]|uniref:GH16 domain-containing protein n=1 Tax=Gossypium barbadense TaxID=3634 RepID=A0A2P5YDK8_GOSBA|nr:hypothetical protein GOBAR_AA06968 [Gossypium barbadense]
MISFSSFKFTLLLPLMVGCLMAASASNFNNDFDITWGDGRGKIGNNGEVLTLSLDKSSGSGFQSKNEYLFGKIDMQLKLVPGNSAGTVTAYYLSSKGSTWDEIDFEFLGNLSGDPYILHTNVFSQGKEFKNMESIGVPFPKNQPMRIYSSLWNADDWATRGGLVKTDWTQAPFTASYRNFNANACVWSNGASSCKPTATSTNIAWFSQEMDSAKQQRLQWGRRTT